jgi:adenosylcobyric acid synthase
MLCRRITDSVESRCGTVPGLGLLDADIEFAPTKQLRRWDEPLSGYEIHHGTVVRCAEDSWFEAAGTVQGYCRSGIFGTHWHGLFDNDQFRREWLTDVALRAGRVGFRVAADVSVPGRRDAQLDRMADLLAAHLNMDMLLALLEERSIRRPTIRTALRG